MIFDEEHPLSLGGREIRGGEERGVVDEISPGEPAFAPSRREHRPRTALFVLDSAGCQHSFKRAQVVIREICEGPRRHAVKRRQPRHGSHGVEDACAVAVAAQDLRTGGQRVVVDVRQDLVRDFSAAEQDHADLVVPDQGIEVLRPFRHRSGVAEGVRKHVGRVFHGVSEGFELLAGGFENLGRHDPRGGADPDGVPFADCRRTDRLFHGDPSFVLSVPGRSFRGPRFSPLYQTRGEKGREKADFFRPSHCFRRARVV